ncbi:YceD family protein [Desulfofustis glycolicus]|uniref:DUF177 domain-containing protein n=1 Tax=Desulfofustis glycolicus DSM 9705 TaxID=1121409 RepID=A0A1M5VS63_9BACT|nr:DUF177 domain-containing protein [Desulfofustis glycolicus]MCB2216743.1 DUF177 domain-containing protein [Desulfobulbaceae bacterium]SHH78111.1 uncharacterized protein SAMN02745124_01867 [Desulfofustis glycolicus DSM 9705]
MKVAFHQIVGDEYVRRISDDGWFPGDEVTALTPVDGLVSLRRIGSDRVDVTGRMTVIVTAACDRCCRPVSSELMIELTYHCRLGRESVDGVATVAECREEDCQTLFLPEPIIDLGILLREQIYLALPARVLCCSDCRGLCQQCGTDLNDTRCSCLQDGDGGPFSVLRQVKGK